MKKVLATNNTAVGREEGGYSFVTAKEDQKTSRKLPQKASPLLQNYDR